MSETYSIEETKDVLTAMAKFGNAIGISLANDGKITLGEYANFFPGLMALPEAISGITNVPKELSEITPEERAELIAHARAEFEIPQDSAEEFVEDTIVQAISLFGYVRKHFLK